MAEAEKLLERLALWSQALELDDYPVDLLQDLRDSIMEALAACQGILRGAS